MEIVIKKSFMELKFQICYHSTPTKQIIIILDKEMIY